MRTIESMRGGGESAGGSTLRRYLFRLDAVVSADAHATRAGDDQRS